MEFNKRLAAAPTQYEVLVALDHLPRTETKVTPADWRPPQWVAKWVTANTGKKAPRQYGGIVFKVSALDPYAAIEQVAERIEQLSARFALATGTGLRAVAEAWIMNDKQAYPLRVSPRGVKVGALDRNGKIFELNTGTEVDAALELASALDRAAPGPAVAGAWSAVESLLSAADDADNVAAGDRLASVVACSFARAELTRLAHVHAKGATDVLAAKLAAAKSNREKALVLEDAVKAGTVPGFADRSDQAAHARLSELCAEPRKKLADIEAYARSSLRRLYRQRNLVLHGGKTGAIALRSSLRTAAPLIGAGLDRIAHAWFVHGTQPLMVAAHARLQLDLLQTADSRALSLLLE